MGGIAGAEHLPRRERPPLDTIVPNVEPEHDLLTIFPVIRVLLFLLLFSPSLFSRVGEPYVDFVGRAGKAVEDHAASDSFYDRVTLHRSNGKELRVYIRQGNICTEQHFPEGPSDVSALLDQALGKWRLLPELVPGVVSYESTENTLMAAYIEADKKLNIYDNAIFEAHRREKEAARNATTSRSGRLSREAIWSSVVAIHAGSWSTRTIQIYAGFVVAIIVSGFAAAYSLGWFTVLAHEGGHFLAGKLAGWRISEVRLGIGRALRSVRYGETTWSFCLNPLSGGSVHGKPRNGHSSRFGEFCFTAGGPLATTTLLAFLIWARVSLGPFLASASFQAQFAWGVLRLATLLQSITLTSSLLPWRFKVNGELVESDGLAMWNLLLHRRSPTAVRECSSTDSNPTRAARRDQNIGGRKSPRLLVKTQTRR